MCVLAHCEDLQAWETVSLPRQWWHPGPVGPTPLAPLYARPASDRRQYILCPWPLPRSAWQQRCHHDHGIIPKSSTVMLTFHWSSDVWPSRQHPSQFTYSLSPLPITGCSLTPFSIVIFAPKTYKTSLLFWSWFLLSDPSLDSIKIFQNQTSLFLSVWIL